MSFIRIERELELMEKESPYGCTVGIHNDEPAGFQQSCHGSTQVEQVVFKAPLLPFGTETPGRRIQHNTIICVAAALFALGKFEGVFHHPSDAVEAAQFHIDAGPIYHLADGIHVGHLSAHRPGCNRCATCVGEEVEEFVTGLQVFSDVLPVGRLLGENTDVLEAGHFQVEAQL